MESPPSFPSLQYFGVHWGTPELDSAIEVPTPEGQACAGCQEPIEAHDDGYVLNALLGADAELTSLPFHRGCHLASTLSHMAGVCHCARPDISERERGRLTVEWVESGCPPVPQHQEKES